MRRWWIAGICAMFVAGAVGVAFFVELPYYLVQPGSVRPAEQRVEISGAQSFEDDGEVMFTTVLLTKATPALLVRASLDDAIEVRTEQEMYPDGDREGSRQLNRQRMDLSKMTATLVALEHLGIGADVVADGARIFGVVEDSPSDGILVPEDVIVGIDGAAVSMPDEIAGELSDRAPGDAVDVSVLRQGASEPELVSIVLGESPDEAGRPILGVQVEPANPSIDSDVGVAVDSGAVSGPSAGLAWTLAIIDRLTPGSITDGRRIAVTGEMRSDGTVGAVGGVVQKVAAVKRAGIDLFIYPAETPGDEQAAMRELAGDDVELSPVATLDEAIEVLQPDGVQLPA